MKRSELLPKLKRVRDSMERLGKALSELGDDPLLEEIEHLPFTKAGRSSFRVTGTKSHPDGSQSIQFELDPPDGLTKELWLRILQGDRDPLGSELKLLRDAVNRASLGLDCAIARRGKPGPRVNQARSTLFSKCYLELCLREQKMPTAKALSDYAKRSEHRTPESVKQDGNWFRDAQDFLASLRKVKG